MRHLFDEKTFETEIFKIADQVFSGYTERRINYNHDGSEHDGFYETEFLVHCLEVTVSKRAEKALHDLTKLERIINHNNKIYKGKKTIKGWFITRDPLSPEQSDILKRFSTTIQHEHYKEFHSRLIDSVKFLQARENHRFGSIEPIGKIAPDSQRDIPTDTYVDVPFLRAGTKDKTANSGIVSRWLSQGVKRRILVLGDFGAGKSSFLKKVYDNLVKEHLHNKVIRFPIYLNLREFAELESPDEALRRHARRIGLNSFGDSLIRAWKADYTFLMIDGFDEAVPRLTAREVKRLRDLRHQALLIVRRLVSESPPDTPIVIAGRSGFLQTETELQEALGIDSSWERLEAKDFEIHDIDELKSNLTSDIDIPEWLPKRPLLITYYIIWCANNAQNKGESLPEEIGWLRLLEQFCEREIAQIDTLPLVKEDLLDIFGELAVAARKRHLKIGPVTLSDLTSAYRHVMKDEPAGASLGQLLRMPGLVGPEKFSQNGSLDASSGTIDSNQKNFLSYELVEAASARYLVKYMQTLNRELVQNWVGIKYSLTSFGLHVIDHLVERESIDALRIKAAIYDANNITTSNFSQIDMISYVATHKPEFTITGALLNIDDIEIDLLNFPSRNGNFKKINLNSSYIGNVNVERGVGLDDLPYLNNCIIEKFSMNCDFSPNNESLIREKYTSCEIEIVSIDNSGDIALDNLSSRSMVLFTVLKKTYRQSVKGRMESALKAGVGREKAELVDEVVKALERGNYLRMERVQSACRWHPIKSKRDSVENFLNNPTDEQADELLAHGS